LYLIVPKKALLKFSTGRLFKEIFIMLATDNKIDFDKLFNPRSLAFVGASPVPGKWGFIILANILRGAFPGKIYLVNPSYSDLFGMPCYPSVSAIKDDIDLVVITVPAKNVPKVIDDCLAKGITNAVVITSDFSETGKDGAALEKIITEKAKSGGMSIVGPNTMGIVNGYFNLNILMPPIKIEPGFVSIISQSGNVGTQIMSECLRHGIGVSKFVSSGNEAMIKCEDYLSYLLTDDLTKVIVLYVESLKEGKRFVQICREHKASKPIIFFKSGKTQAGQLAAASHTGAMAGSIQIYRSVFKQCGITEAESTEEIIDLIGGFLSFPVPAGHRVGIITIGGGWGVITADECEAHELKVPDLSVEVYDKLNSLLPKYWSKRNPVDMVAVLSMDIYPKIIEAVTAWDEVDSVISLGGPSIADFFEFGDIAEKLGLKMEQVSFMAEEIHRLIDNQKKIILEFMKKYNKPVFHVEMGTAEEIHRNMKTNNYITYKSPERAVRVLKKMAEYGEMKNSMNQ
jgi:acyl-CoA synthetase (NDP forming)